MRWGKLNGLEGWAMRRWRVDSLYFEENGPACGCGQGPLKEHEEVGNDIGAKEPGRVYLDLLWG